MNPDTKRFYPTDAERESMSSLADPRPIDATVAMRQVQVQPDWTRFEVGETLEVTRLRRGVIPVKRQLVVTAITEELLVCRPNIDFPTGATVEAKGVMFAVELKRRRMTVLRPVGQKPA